MNISPHHQKQPNRNAQDTGTFEDVLQSIAENAKWEDAGTARISGSIALLHGSGLMSDDGTENPVRSAQRLMRLGAANLSAGRIVEGHMNALYLAKVHGTADIVRQFHRLVSTGAVLGVWGADDAEPVAVDHAEGVLRGGKKFASGLGTVTHAIVLVNVGSQIRLALLDVTHVARQDAGRWQMTGMKATVSGAFNCDGLPVSSFTWIGEPGDYFREPHFIGGVWRIGALQIGGALGLVDSAARKLRQLDRMGADAQKARLGQVMVRALGGAALVRQAALQATKADAENAVALSVSARLLTESVAQDCIREVERSLGLSHFEAGSETNRMARDLSVYLRQAAGDALLMRFADRAFRDSDAIWELVGWSAIGQSFRCLR